MPNEMGDSWLQLYEAVIRPDSIFASKKVPGRAVYERSGREFRRQSGQMCSCCVKIGSFSSVSHKAVVCRMVSGVYYGARWKRWCAGLYEGEYHPRQGDT